MNEESHTHKKCKKILKNLKVGSGRDEVCLNSWGGWGVICPYAFIPCSVTATKSMMVDKHNSHILAAAEDVNDNALTGFLVLLCAHASPKNSP